MKQEIFILEDNPVDRKLYKAILKDYSLTISHNVDDAIAICEVTKFDLYIVDILILGSSKSGEDLIEVGIDPALIVSAYALRDIKAKDHIYYLAKPFKPEQLLNKIKSIIDGKS